MVTLNLAYSAPVNPAGTSTILTAPQLWVGLQRKVRKAYEFVPAIGECEVLNEEETADGNVVTRQVKFNEGYAPAGSDGGWVRERCVEMSPCRVDFRQDDGSTISNIISSGPSQEETDLIVTYAFEWRHPKVEAGSDMIAGLMDHHKKTAKMAVDHSIMSIRKMVESGDIKA